MKRWKQQLTELVRPEPKSPEDWSQLLARAEEREVIATESRLMLEGVLRMAGMTAGDVMVAAPRMDVLSVDAPTEELFNTVIETAHSRFPVYEGERDNIIGILLAKDLLKLQRAPELHLRSLLRPPVFIPETKRLNDLLRDFRGTRNHLAIVIDEFGRLAGLITIEDVLEEIVGEIEDEFDEDEEAGDIYRMADKSWRVSGDTSIERINEAFALSLPEEGFETIGGWIAHRMGQVPRRGEWFDVEPWRFSVMHARAGMVRWFKVFALAEDIDRD
jgi:magnesium and cobalt transporter